MYSELYTYYMEYAHMHSPHKLILKAILRPNIIFSKFIATLCWIVSNVVLWYNINEY